MHKPLTALKLAINMGACVDRDVSFEKDTVKHLRTQMIIEYLKHNESDVKNIRSTSAGTPKHSIRPARPKKADISQDGSKNLNFSAYADKRAKEFNLVLEALTPKVSPVDLPSNRSQESQFQFSNRCISVGKALIGLQNNLGEPKQNNESKGKIVEEIDGDAHQTSGYIQSNVVQPQFISDSKSKHELKKLNTEVFPKTGENLLEQDYKQKFNTEVDSSSEDDQNCNPSPGKSVFGSKDPMFDFRSPELLIKLEAAENINVIKASSKSSKRSSKSFNQSYSENEKFSGRLLVTENKESISSRDLELQALGVNLPSMNAINLKFDESYHQMRSTPPLDPNNKELAFENESSPRKNFLLQLPSHIPQLLMDFEPNHSEANNEESEISDFSNRPVSPRIDSKKPHIIAVQAKELVNSFELKIPEVPVTFVFQAQYLPQTDEAKNQLFAENKESDEQNEGNEVQEILLEDFEVVDKSSFKISKGSAKKALRSGRQMEKSSRYNVESEGNDSPNFMATPEVEPLNLLLGPEINNFYRDPLIFEGGYRKENSGRDLDYLGSRRSDLAYNRSLSPEYSSYNRMESPNPNKSFESAYRNSWIPSITIMRESGGNPFPVADSFNIPDIRASINSSMFKNSKVHLLRKSPQRLRPELHRRNLEGKLTAQDELTLQG